MAVRGYERIKVELDRLVVECENPQWLYEAGEYVRDVAQTNLASKVKRNTGDLMSSIELSMSQGEDGLEAVIGTNNQHCLFVEFGTGPVGAANHDGISPTATPIYRSTPWGIPEGSNGFTKADAEFYGMKEVSVNGQTYFKTAGQPAKPYLYPALADNIDMVIDIAKKGFDEAVKGIK